MQQQLIVVSNRGPVSYARDDAGERVTRRGGGGLVTALRGLLSDHSVTWIASAIGDEDRVVAAEHGGTAFDEETQDGDQYRLRLVAHDPDAYDRFYNVVANPLLWFLQHSLWDLGNRPDVRSEDWTEGYEPVNRGFADAVLAELEQHPDARVFFHDYHLYLAPGLVRAARPHAALAHFVHIPWPQSEAWHVLPEPLRRAVFEGLLANDVVGFHTTRWARSFVRGCESVVGAVSDNDSVEHRDRRTLVTSHPISIDPAEFDTLAVGAPVVAAADALFDRRPEQVVLRVDRTDPSKNIVRGFRAFGTLLDRYPEHRGRVTMLALLDPSRQDIPEYVEYRAALEREAATVNARFGDDAWLPVDLRIRDDFPQTVAAYLDYDVLFINAVYDGLNLVAKEGPLVNRRNGAVVLSENSGVHQELGRWSLTVNPFDVEGQADALHAALTMDPADRADRAVAIAGHVRRHDVAHWIAAQLADLDRATLLAMSDLSHVDSSGDVRMVDVGAKPQQRRRARARAVVHMAPATATRLRDLPKGDALVTAQLAGIMAAKRTAELIPLCHPLPLSHVDVTAQVGDDQVEIVAEVSTTAQTGVEMEALTAAAVAALTVYDMAKAIDKEMRFEVVLLEKVKE